MADEKTADYVDVRGAAAHLNKTVRTIRNWQARRLIPHFRIGRTVMFRLSDLDAHFARNCKVAATV